MEMSQEFDKIAPAFVKAQASFEDAIKNQVNGHLKNNYADLSAVIDACKPALTENGIAILQTTPTADITDPDGRVNSVIIITTLLHESGQWFRSSLKMPLTITTAQGVGSAITYGRRYALAAMCGVAQVDDDANEVSGTNRRYENQGTTSKAPATRARSSTSQQKQRQQQRQAEQQATDEPPPPISEDRLAYLEQMIIDTGTHRDSFLKYCRVDDLKNMPVTKYLKARNALEEKALGLGQTDMVRPKEDADQEEQPQTEAA